MGRLKRVDRSSEVCRVNVNYATCEYCDKMAPVSYYCEKCHAIFCADCLRTPTQQERVCGNCGSNAILKDINGVEFCQSCKSEQVGQIHRSLKVCPSCNAPAAVKIDQKKQTLVQHFFKTIQDSRQILAPITEVVQEFNGCRQKLLAARFQTPSSNHFPSLEPEVAKLAILFDQIKAGVQERVLQFYRNVQHNRRFFNDSVIQPQDIPLLENTLGSVRNESQELVKYASRCFQKMEEDLKSIKARVNFIEGIVTQFRPYLHLLDLKRQERPVFGLPCTVKCGTSQDGDIGKKTGIILLTNHKVYFIHEHGFIRKKSDLLFSTPLRDLENAEVRGKIFKTLLLNFNHGSYSIALEKDDRIKLMQYIEMAKSFDESNHIDKDKLHELGQIRLSTRDLRQFMEEQISNLISVKMSLQQTTFTLQYAQDPSYTPSPPRFAQSSQAPAVAYDPSCLSVPQAHHQCMPQYSVGQVPYVYSPAPPLPLPQAPPYIPRDPRNIYQPLPGVAPSPVSFPSPTTPVHSPEIYPPAPNPIPPSWGPESRVSPGEPFVDEKHLILKYEREAFGLQQSIHWLDQKFKNQEITQGDFIKAFRNLNQELFTVNRQLETLREKQGIMDENLDQYDAYGAQ